jgi:hypothetical protein
MSWRRHVNRDSPVSNRDILYLPYQLWTADRCGRGQRQHQVHQTGRNCPHDHADLCPATTLKPPAVERPASHHVAAVTPALIAVWCRSVGTSWTLGLHQLDNGPAPGGVGYVCPDAELAHLVRGKRLSTLLHRLPRQGASPVTREHLTDIDLAGLSGPTDTGLVGTRTRRRAEDHSDRCIAHRRGLPFLRVVNRMPAVARSQGFWRRSPSSMTWTRCSSTDAGRRGNHVRLGFTFLLVTVRYSRTFLTSDRCAG